jgi:hypothetical protein
MGRSPKCSRDGAPWALRAPRAAVVRSEISRALSLSELRAGCSILLHVVWAFTSSQSRRPANTRSPIAS